MYNALFVSQLNQTVQSISTDDYELAVLRLREGTGGEFGNIIITNNGRVCELMTHFAVAVSRDRVPWPACQVLWCVFFQVRE